MRIVYLIHKNFYLNKLCRARFLVIEAFCKKYNHDLVYTGVGWDNYNDNTFLNENLKQLEPIHYIFCYKPLLYNGIQNIKYPKIIEKTNDRLLNGYITEISPSDCALESNRNEASPHSMASKNTFDNNRSFMLCFSLKKKSKNLLCTLA